MSAVTRKSKAGGINCLPRVIHLYGCLNDIRLEDLAGHIKIFSVGVDIKVDGL